MLTFGGGCQNYRPHYGSKRPLYGSGHTALIRAAECIAAEVKPHGVAVFSVAPGSVYTEMTKRSLLAPDGRRWIPWYQRIFEEGLDLPAERPAALVAALASGKYDALSGLFLTPFDDLDTLVANRSQIDDGRLHTLQLRPLNVSAAALAAAAIRDGGASSQPPKD